MCADWFSNVTEDSVANQGRTPGEATTHSFHEDQLAPLDAAVIDGFGQRQGDGGGRCVGMAVDR